MEVTQCEGTLDPQTMTGMHEHDEQVERMIKDTGTR